jgi:hypothetical protein
MRDRRSWQFRAVVAAIALTVFDIAPVLAQEVCGADPEAAWRLASAQHGERRQSLGATRGIVLAERGPRADVRAIAAVLTEQQRAGRQARLLAYASDAAMLCIWAFDGSGIAAYARVPVSLDEVAALQFRFADGLGVDTQRQVRLPQARRAGIALKPVSAPATTLGKFRGGLTDALLPSSILPGIEGADQLTVVPVGSIGAVPFGLLAPWTGRGPLLEHMSITIAPGLQDALRPPAAQRERQRALVIGDPDLSGDPDWQFPPLPGARTEAEAVARILRVQPLLGQQASLEIVVRRLAERPTVIYFATHAIADPDDPLDGGFLALTSGRLTARSIQAQSFGASAPLVVLSACQTGLGRAHDAGIIGVARAFAIAGASNVLMSLWSVEDTATARLMERFMGLRQELAPADALREAMLVLRREFADPIYWAGFAVFGAMERSGPVDPSVVRRLLQP